MSKKPMVEPAKPSKTATLVMNIIIALIAVVSIAMMFLMPFWSIDATLKMDGNLIESLGLEESLGEDETMTQAVSDLKSSLDKDPVNISLQLKLQSKELISALTSKDAKATVENFITEQVGVIMDGLRPALDGLKTTVVKVSAKTAVMQAKNSMFQELATEEDKVKVDTALNAAGFNDNFIDEKIDSLVEAINKDAKVENVVSEIQNIADESIDKIIAAVEGDTNGVLTELLGSDLANIKNETDQAKKTQLIADAKSAVNDAVEEMVTELVAEMNLEDSKGEINLDAFLANILNSALNQGSGDDGATSEQSNPTTNATMDGASGIESGTTSSGSTSGTATDTTESKTLEETLSDFLLSKLGSEESIESVLMALQILAIVLVVTAVAWLYLLVKLFVKIFCKNKTVGLFIPRHIGWIAYVVLVGIPFLINFVISHPETLQQLTEKLGQSVDVNSVMGEMGGILGNFSLVCNSGTIASAIGTVVLLLMLIPYRSLRKKYKKRIKWEKQNKQ